MPTTLLNRYLVALALVLGLLGSAALYRNHLLDTGFANGVRSEQTRQADAKEATRQMDESTSAAVTAVHQAQLKTLKDQHDRVTRNLKTALDDSDLRAARLDARIVGLLNAAAGVREGTPSYSLRPGRPLDASEGDSTLAILIETVNENYALCRADQARLDRIQDWYNALRANRAAPE